MNLLRSRSRIGLVLAAFLLLAAACGSDDSVAEVEDGGALTEEELVEGIEEQRSGQAAQIEGGESLETADLGGVVGQAEAADLVTRWIRNEVFYGELAARDFAVEDFYFDDAEAEMSDLAVANPDVPELDSFEGQLTIRGIALSQIVADYLESVGAEPIWPVQLCSSHILLETEEEALAAIERLDGGADFAELAVELSTGPSGPTGGDLGCVDPNGFVAEFVAGAAEVDAPGISEPVESEFGWHVINVRSFDATPSEDPVAIQNAYFSTPEFEEFRIAALEREVTVDPQYGVWDAVQAAVVPG